MRHIWLIIAAAGLALGGCASTAQRAGTCGGPAVVNDTAERCVADPRIVASCEDELGAAAALVFDPPVILGEPPVMLAREDRQAGAFVGYQDQTITSFWIQIDDRQTGHPRWDRYERRATIEKVGTSYR